jgi:glycosyltransferase involved in cell wall biosynthesis
MEKYPKILILGNPFNNKTGGGITMSNLFKGWPKDRLALASVANLLFEADTSLCKKYFQLGYNGKLHPFPLSIVLPKVPCGPFEVPDSPQSKNQSHVQIPGRYKKVYNKVMPILSFLGLTNFLYKIKITSEFKNWLAEFNPDLIYSQLGSLSLIRHVSDVADILKKPVALHFMDDWISILNRPGLLYWYWKRTTDTELKILIERSSVLMSIGEAMSEEYYHRYKREFIPFHNPIEIDEWIQYRKTEQSVNDKFTILYAGRIGLGMKNSVIDVANVVQELSDENNDIVFEIQTSDLDELKGLISFNEHIIWIKPTSYSELPKRFSRADLLLLPVDFDSKSKKFLRFSFQTKISEYMISGTPVLVYGPEGISTTKFAIKGKWAFVVTERDKIALKTAILELKSNAGLRKSLGERGKFLALNNENASLVREQFREILKKNTVHDFQTEG